MHTIEPTAEINNVGDLIGWGREHIRPDIQTAYRGLPTSQFYLIPGIMRVDPVQSGVQASYGWNWEQQLLEEFEKKSIPYLKIIPQNKLEWIALAQHHGLPTRLLDWTQNLLIALFFAVDDPQEKWINDDAIVWQLDGALLNNLYPETLEQINQLVVAQPNGIYFPYHTTTRMSAQQGCFTIHSYDPYSRATALEYIHGLEGFLHKFVIPHSRKDAIRQQLDKIGINYFSLFPDLDGLCRQLQWKFSMAHNRLQVIDEE